LWFVCVQACLPALGLGSRGPGLGIKFSRAEKRGESLATLQLLGPVPAGYPDRPERVRCPRGLDEDGGFHVTRRSLRYLGESKDSHDYREYIFAAWRPITART